MILLQPIYVFLHILFLLCYYDFCQETVLYPSYATSVPQQKVKNGFSSRLLQRIVWKAADQQGPPKLEITQCGLKVKE